MSAIETIQAEIDKREQEIEALRLSLSIISGKADIRIVKSPIGDERESPESPVGDERGERVERVAPTKLRRNQWRKQEDKKLKEMYEQGLDDSEIGKELGRTVISVRCRRSIIGSVFMRRPRKPKVDGLEVSREFKSWTTLEDDKLKQMVNLGLTNLEIAGKLGRTGKSISVRKVRLGLRGTTAYPLRPTEKVRKERIEKPFGGFGEPLLPPGERHNMPWTKRDIEDLSRLTGEGKSTDEIAEELGRTRSSVYVRKHGMGMTKKRAVKVIKKRKKGIIRTRWTGADDQILVGMYKNGYSPKQIGERIKRTSGAVRVRLHHFKSKGKL